MHNNLMLYILMNLFLLKSDFVFEIYFVINHKSDYLKILYIIFITLYY